MEKNGAINSQTPSQCCGGRCQPRRTMKSAEVLAESLVQYPASDREAEAMAPQDVVDRAIQQAAGE